MSHIEPSYIIITPCLLSMYPHTDITLYVFDTSFVDKSNVPLIIMKLSVNYHNPIHFVYYAGCTKFGGIS